MSEEKRRILDMVEQGTITQEDAARLLEALGENEPAPVQPQESQPPQDGTWEAEHQGDEDCQGPNQRVEIHLEGEGAKPIYQEIAAALDEAAPALERLGSQVDAAVSRAAQAVEAAWPQVRDTLKDTGEKAKKAAQAARESVLAGAPGPEAALVPLPVEENAYPEAPLAGEITALKIQWVSGPVEVRPWEGDTLRVNEYCKRPLQERERLALQEKGGELSIRWCPEGSLRGKLFLQKHLVVEVPQALQLDQLRVEHVSGGIYLGGLQGGRLRLNNVSGPVCCQGVRAQALRVESVSGAVSLTEVSAQELRVNATSGKAELCGFAAQRLRAETVSGGISAVGNGEELHLSTVSGAVRLQAGQLPQQVRVTTVSGRISLLLPETETGFSVEYTSMSGSFSSQFPLSGELGRRKGRAVCGGGGARVRLDTVSGPMELCPVPGLSSRERR